VEPFEALERHSDWMERVRAAFGAAGAREETEDAPLVGEAIAGSAEAYEQLYRRHRDRVARAVYLALGDADLAQDIAQEAFLVGWRDLARLRDPRVFRAWVTGIALNLVRRPGVRRRLADRASGGPADVAIPGGQDGAELRLTVRQAVAALPARMRSVVVLRFYGGFTEPEIGAALGIPVGTVKSRLMRARAKLADALGPLIEEG